jgi:hypothetical protein
MRGPREEARPHGRLDKKKYGQPVHIGLQRRYFAHHTGTQRRPASSMRAFEPLGHFTSVGRWAVVNRRWIVIDTKSGQRVGKFASRYGAMVFAERLKGPPGRFAVIDEIEPSRVVRFEPKASASIERA